MALKARLGRRPLGYGPTSRSSALTAPNRRRVSRRFPPTSYGGGARRAEGVFLSAFALLETKSPLRHFVTPPPQAGRGKSMSKQGPPVQTRQGPQAKRPLMRLNWHSHNSWTASRQAKRRIEPIPNVFLCGADGGTSPAIMPTPDGAQCGDKTHSIRPALDLG